MKKNVDEQSYKIVDINEENSRNERATATKPVVAELILLHGLRCFNFNAFKRIHTQI